MPFRLPAIMLFCLFGTSLFGQNTLTLDSTTLTIDTVITGLDVPWEIAWGNDGWVWCTERYGMVSRIDPNTGTKDTILDIDSIVYSSGESGLLGMALHPDFADTPNVYLVYTYVSGTIKERMVRYEYNGTSLVNPHIMIDNITGNTTHDGSRLVIGPDYKLYMTTGEAQNQPQSQNLNSLNGKFLRFNLDGSVPADNPIPGSYIYTWGHRNAQGMVFGPTGILYSSEHGPTTDDEFNIIVTGRNYGWPTVAGFCDNPNETTFCADSNVVEPLRAWTPTIAPGDITFYDDPAIPEWQGAILLAVLKNKQLKVLHLNAVGDSLVNEQTYLINQFGRFRDVLQGPNGEIYIATNGADWSNSDPGTHSIIRLQNLRFNQPPTITAGTADTICASDSVTLGGNPTATGGAMPYTYQWNPTTDLSCSNCANPVAKPTQNQTYTLTVTDSNNTSVTDSVSIIVQAFDTLSGTGHFVGGLIDSFYGGTFGYNASTQFPGGGTWWVVLSLEGDTSTYIGTSFIDTIHYFECVVKRQDWPSCWAGVQVCFTPFGYCESYYVAETMGYGDWGAVHEVLNKEILRLSPNPTNSQLSISITQSNLQMQYINLYNNLGQQILTLDPEPEKQVVLDVSSLAKGLYLVQVQTDKGLVTRKLLLE